MSASSKPYHALPGRSFGFMQVGSLWLGPDHLLLVATVPGGEAYRRFFFADIQAVVVRRTRTRTYFNLVFGAVAAMHAALAAYLLGLRGFDGWVWFNLAGVLAWLVLVLINTVRGPTCQTRIQTAVQYERVPSLSRLRTVRRVMEQLRPRLHAAQSTEAGS